MASETLIKCAHPPCQCLVEEEQRFCSSACDSAKGASRCMCGHPGCVAQHEAAEGDEFDPLSAE